MNQITVTSAASTSNLCHHLETFGLPLQRSCWVSFHTGSVLFKVSVQDTALQSIFSQQSSCSTCSYLNSGHCLEPHRFGHKTSYRRVILLEKNIIPEKLPTASYQPFSLRRTQEQMTDTKMPEKPLNPGVGGGGDVETLVCPEPSCIYIT